MPAVPDRFEVVASMCLLTQIIDSVVSITGPGAVPMELVGALRQRHLRLLAELLLPGGIGILVTDFALEQDGGHFLGMSPQELCTLASNNPILRTQLCQARVSPSWLWRQNGRRTLRVCAISFQRIQEGPVEKCGLDLLSGNNVDR